MDHRAFTKRKPNPRENANIFSLISFFYVRKVFGVGHGGDLEEDDLFYVMRKLRSKKLGDRIEQIWNKQKEHRQMISTARLLFALCFKKFIILGIIQLVMKTFLVITTPYVLGKFVLYFTSGQSEVTTQDAYFYGILVVGINVISSIYDQNYTLLNTEITIEAQTALCSLIYRKSLKLSPEALSNISIGKIVTLLSKDINVFEYVIAIGNSIWVDTIEVVVIVYLIYTRVGVAGIIGFGFLFLSFPFQILMARMVYMRRTKCNKKSDERLKLTQEILSTIRIIKMYTWEKLFNDKITATRKKEMHNLRGLFILKGVIYTCGKMCSKLSFYMLVSSYVWLGNNLTAEIAYYILNCYENLENTFTYLLPFATGQIGELKSSLRRYDAFFNAEEIKWFDSKQFVTITPEIKLRNADVVIADNHILKNVSVTFKQGLNIVIGPVGSGKSSLLKVLLREYALTQGTLHTQGSMTYASQNPWLFPSTIKQNILFGQKFDSKRYKKILNICSLNFDLDTLANGDKTVIGDCGINLSKGQQSRINLARALYRDCDIYFFDDCLSALDTYVRKEIFTNCIKNYLKNKLCILVTHQEEFMHHADNITVLEEGRVSYSGQPSGLAERYIVATTDENNVSGEMQNIHTEVDKYMINGIEEEYPLLSEETCEGTINIYHEDKKSGNIPWSVFKTYLKFGGYPFFILIAILIISADGCNTYGNKLVSEWVNMDENIIKITKNNSNSSEFDNLLSDRSYLFQLYTIMVMGSAVLYLVSFFFNFIFTTGISNKLHELMISKIFGTTMHFFDTHLIGNVLNRFSKDLYYIDEELAYGVSDFISIILMASGAVALITSVNRMFLILTFVFFGIYTVVGYYFLPLGRNLRRLNSSTRSPVVGHLNASLEGIATVRVCGSQDKLINEFDYKQDLYTSANYTLQLVETAFAFSLKLFSYIFVGIIVANFLFIKTDLSGNVGLAISQAFILTTFLEYCLKEWFELQSQMTCFERALEYTDLPQETSIGEILNDWPSTGKIVFEKVCLKYRSKNEQVLRDVSFEVNPGEKVSIVGRTGAGKSSIIVGLFRLYEFEGRILIDSVDISGVPLNSLRTNMTIIPQDPILFTGSMRSNMDPFGKHTDHEIWKAVDAVKLKPMISDLEEIVNDSGARYSIGQRQLICLARAFLNKTRIIVLDEATANMDEEMDKYIQQRINEHFPKCTIISISHRLPAVMLSDKVLVMERGELIEFGKPSVLLKEKNGVFYKMVLKSKML